MPLIAPLRINSVFHSAMCHCSATKSLPSTLRKSAPETLPSVPPAQCTVASPHILRLKPKEHSPHSESLHASDTRAPAAQSAHPQPLAPHTWTHQCVA